MQEKILTNFQESHYTNERGRKYPKYNLTEEAFTLVVLGTTRKKQCKQNSFYTRIQAHEKHIQNQQQVPTDA